MAARDDWNYTEPLPDTRWEAYVRRRRDKPEEAVFTAKSECGIAIKTRAPLSVERRIVWLGTHPGEIVQGDKELEDKALRTIHAVMDATDENVFAKLMAARTALEYVKMRRKEQKADLLPRQLDKHLLKELAGQRAGFRFPSLPAPRTRTAEMTVVDVEAEVVPASEQEARIAFDATRRELESTGA